MVGKIKFRNHKVRDNVFAETVKAFLGRMVKLNIRISLNSQMILKETAVNRIFINNKNQG